MYEKGRFLDEELEDIVSKISSSLNHPETTVRDVVMHQFKFTAKVIRDKELKSIRWRYFGTFRLSYIGWREWYLRECERETRSNNKGLEERNLEEPESRANGTDTSSDMRPVSKKLV